MNLIPWTVYPQHKPFIPPEGWDEEIYDED